MVKKSIAVYPYVSPRIMEEFRAEVKMEPVRFPKELGEEHPHSFEECEKVLRKFGIVKAIIDKHLDFVMGPGFRVKSSVKKAEQIINDFNKKVGFYHIVRQWLMEGLSKGNGFMEIAMNKNELDVKVTNANYMYVQRKKTGEVIGYNQYAGKMDNRFPSRKVIPFKEDEIAHLKMDVIGDDAYGMGTIQTLLKNLDYLAMSERDSHMLTMRKANEPIIATVGTPEEPATQTMVDTVGQKLEYLNNMHEWAFGHNVVFSKLDFGNMGDKFGSIIEHDLSMLFYISQVPAVLMGMANVPEGLAESQRITWERRIKSIQELVEKIIEEKIYQRILKANGLQAEIEIEWGLPDKDEINKRTEKLTMLIGNPMLSPQMRAMIERDLARTLGYDEADVNLLPKPEMIPEVERDEEGNIKQPEIPGEKPNAKEMRLKSWVWNQESEETEEALNSLSITEWLNFDYQNYKSEVLKFVDSDEFKNLRATNQQEISLGLLTSEQISLLKNILKDNFQKSGTMKDIINDLKQLNLSDRYTLKDGQKRLVSRADERRVNIARSEVTRISNEAILTHYGNKGVNEVRFLASISSRTCERCLGLNGQVFNINEATGVIPVHQNCRCGWIAITE